MELKKKAAILAAVFALLLAGSAVWIWTALRPAGDGAKVCVYHDGVLLEEYPLDADGTYQIELEDGAVNVIEIRDGGVCVSESNCANQVCVQTGVIRSGAYPIVCLPHALVVQIEDGDGGPDGVAR